MRTSLKFLAVAALAIASTSSFAAQVDWTGSLASVKIKIFPNNSGAGADALLLTGTGSTCSWVGTPGAMMLSSSSNEGGNSVRNLFNFLADAKKSGSTVTLTYDNATTLCDIKGYTR